MDAQEAATETDPKGTEVRLRPQGMANLSKEEVMALPLAQYHGPVIQVTDAVHAEVAVEELLEEEVLGFDTESRPSFERGKNYPPSLVQIAGEHGVWLFCIHDRAVLDALRPLFEVERPVKTGVAPIDDVRKLSAIVPMRPAGVVDLADSAKALGLAKSGLRALAALFLGVRVSKRAQTTNWARRPLSSQQVAYAAVDAWLCRQLYLELKARGVLKAGSVRKAA
jgi:ribonuclease D